MRAWRYGVVYKLVYRVLHRDGLSSRNSPITRDERDEKGPKDKWS